MMIRLLAWGAAGVLGYLAIVALRNRFADRISPRKPRPFPQWPRPRYALATVVTPNGFHRH
jgi:hypothetical protein